MTRASDRHSLTARLLAAAIPAGLALWRWALPQRPLWAVGPRALVDAVFAIILGAYLLLLAAAIGDRLGKKLWAGTTRLESTVFATAGGMGLLSHGMLLLGLAGLASRGIVVAVIVILGWVFGDSVVHQARVGSKALAQALLGVGRLTRFQKTILAFCAVALLATFLLSLAPPTIYDALMYHLVAPRDLLEHHALPKGTEAYRRMAESVQLFYPQGAEMLFAFGLALASEGVAHLLHLSFAILTGLVVFTMAKRFASEKVAWTALALLLTMPILPIWAGQAQIDFIWSLYEILAIYAVLLWWQSDSRHWLLAAGIFSALALSTKYLAVASVLVLALLILWKSIAEGWQTASKNVVTFSLLAIGIASPWYLKNWVWVGNPVYPYFLKGGELPSQMASWIDESLGSFGYREGLIGFLTLPWDLYVHHEAFGAVWNGMDFLSPLFPLVLAYPFLRHGPEGRWVKVMLAIMGLRFLVWGVVSQQTRFLVPIVPLLCIGTATVLVRLAKIHRFGVRWNHIVQAVQIAVVSVSCLYVAWACLHLSPFQVIVGIQSRDAYLREQVGDYPAQAYLREQAPADAQILLIADGRGST